jgi:hypothetical protein
MLCGLLERPRLHPRRHYLVLTPRLSHCQGLEKDQRGLWSADRSQHTDNIESLSRLGLNPFAIYIRLVLEQGGVFDLHMLAEGLLFSAQAAIFLTSKGGLRGGILSR